MLYGYCRVSSVSQKIEGSSLEAQKKQLMDSGVLEENIYTEAYTGTKTDRPVFTGLLAKLKAGDTLVVTKLDRFARSSINGQRTIQELLSKDIKVNILNMGLMDNTPNSKLIRNIFFAFAEFERDMIVERTQEGKEEAKKKAKANGEVFKEGRKATYSKAQMKHASNLKLEGYSYKIVTEMTGISKPTLYRYMKENGLIEA